MAEETYTPFSQDENLIGPLRRMNAFLGERLRITEGEDESTSRSLGEEATPPNLPEKYLEQLNAYRNRIRQQAEDSAPDVTSREAIVAPPQNNWIPIGPSAVRKGQAAGLPVVSGRTPGVAISPGGQRIYIGAASGGVWRSEDGGRSWVSLMDRTADSYSFDLNLHGGHATDPISTRATSLACGALVVDFGNSASEDRIFMGSGEGFMANWMATVGPYLMYGVGVVVSLDGGNAWQTESASTAGTTLVGSGFYTLALDPNNTERLVAASRAGLYRREDDGSGTNTFHWVQKNAPGAVGHPTGVVAAQTGGTTTFYAVFTDGRVYQSGDGDTWAQLGGPLTGGAGRTTLAVHPERPGVVYAFRQTGSVFRWENGDASGTWHNVANIPVPNRLVGTQGHYDLSIAVAPESGHSDRIYLGGSTVKADPNGTIYKPTTNPTPPPDPNDARWSAALYRCDITVARTGATITGVSATNTYIGATVHADVHNITFEPNNPRHLWVGCDGGVYFSNNPTGTGRVFIHRNNGLQTLTMNSMGLHPTEDAVMFCGTQDNGTLRFTGEPMWLHSAPGDGGYVVIDWDNPYRVLVTYTNNVLRRTTTGGDFPTAPGAGRYSTFNALWVGGSAMGGVGQEAVLFYAPLVGSPPPHLKVPSAPAPTAPDAAVVAFGSIRPWISRNFGAPGSWNSIPNGTAAGDNLGSRIRSLVFANSDKLYAGTMQGQVHRFDFNSGTSNWAATRIDNAGASPLSTLSTAGSGIPVTSIAVDSTDNTGNTIYIALGGVGDWRHVWRFDGTNWTARSGPSSGHANSLLDVQHNALAVDTATNDVYVGADIGVWHSTDGGQNWNALSSGLPDASVLDLKIQPARMDGTTVVRPPLLRASTHGRGVWERTIESANKFGVELYFRDTLLDTGRYVTVDGADDPRNSGAGTVSHTDSVSIKVDTPDNNGFFQAPTQANRPVMFTEYIDELEDRSGQVATHDSAIIISKVHVHVHNRGVLAANGVRVTLLLSPMSGRTDLPNNYHTAIQAGNTVSGDSWVTVGVETISQVRAGHPGVVTFDLPSSLLPTPTNLAGNESWNLVALIDHDDDAFGDPARGGITLRDVNDLTQQSRHATQKVITVAAFTGTLPTQQLNVPLAGYVEIPASATEAGAPFDYFLADSFRLNDAFFEKSLTALIVSTGANGGITSQLEEDPSAVAWVQANEIAVRNTRTLTNRTPLVWMAREKITLEAAIDARGRGAQAGEPGDFGGSGGGGNAPGEPTQLPVSTAPVRSGGGTGSPGNSFPTEWASRILGSLALCRGGAAGGGANPGAGGGIVCLCAPTIEFAAGGSIDVRGEDGGAGNSGGGGGGLVILLANEITGMVPTGAGQNVFIAGGAGSGGGGAGGDGLLLQMGN